MNKQKRVAIIGAGISGLSSAYHLYKDFDVTVYEKEDYFGGHTDTHTFNIDGQHVNIDSGFIVFCKQFYPHFSSMLDELGVESQKTEMSFSARNHQTGVIYNATSLNKLFCQRKNLFRPSFYRMLIDLYRFYSNAPDVLENADYQKSVHEYLQQNNYSAAFIDDHLLPMISALWSATPERVAQFPIHHLVEYLHKHGMMKLINRPEWLVVKGGSRRYVDALHKKIKCHWKINSPVERVERRNDGSINITTSEQKNEIYDAVIIATHSDQALKLLDKPSDDEQAILERIKYEDNHVVVHTDDSIMDSNKQSWASWNTEVPHSLDSSTQKCCTANYWMNLLQNLPIKTNVFATLNSHHRIQKDKILQQRTYSHPIFTAESVAAQKQKHLINGQQNTYYVGAYWGWGFHEDGARSAYEAAQLIKNRFVKNPSVELKHDKSTS